MKSARPDWCARCVADQYDTHGKFEGTKNLRPAVTTVKGTRLCGLHVAETLDHPSVYVPQQTGTEIRMGAEA